MTTPGQDRSPRGVYLFMGGVGAATLFLSVVVAGIDWSTIPLTGMPPALLAAILVGATALAQRYPLHLTYQTKVNVDAAVLIAAALLLAPPRAMAAAALAVALHHALARTSWAEGIFDVAQTALIVGTGSAVFHLATAADLGPRLDGFGSVAGVLLCALTIFLINSLAVSTIGALQLGLDPLRAAVANLLLDAPEQAALSIFGAIIAVVAQDHPWLLPAFVVPVALVHRSLRRSIDLRVATQAAVEELAEIVDHRDGAKIGHSRRVSASAARLAERLGLSAPEVLVVTAAASVHDVGKVALNPRLVAKPGPLDAADWDEIHRHPAIGADLIARFPTYAPGARAVRHHHERWDGAGYPDGLAGEDIPLAARIIAVADAFDAMTSRRPHRPAMNESAALDELERGAGRQWDPRVAAAQAALVHEERERSRERRTVDWSPQQIEPRPATARVPHAATG